MEKVPNKYIRVAYKLHTGQGEEMELVEETTREQPFRFITGLGYALDAFEQALTDLQKGETFDFTVPFMQAYGEYDPEHRSGYPRSLFEVEGKFDDKHIFEGNVVQMLDSNRKPLLCTVISVGKDEVILDFNHPLAGQDLRFSGEIIESREALPEEVEAVLHPAHEDCGCCCGHCGGNESDNCSSDCDCGHCH